ncbi:MAG: nucleotidyltransferase family protein [Parvularculaceae bacterium]
MLTESPEAEAARVIAAEPCVRRVILFGSRVAGAEGRASDMDLAIDAPNVDARALSRIRDALDARRSLVSIDLLLLNDAPPEWRERIEQTGRILFRRSI